jgi:ribonuclease HI
MKLLVYTDGGSRGNPGPAWCGVFVADQDGNSVEKRFKYIGVATNNIAEYTAALLGISRAIDLGATEFELRADSKLVIEQLSGNYKIKNPELKKIFLEIQERIGKWWGKISFIHVYREQNTEADRLSNVAMDRWMIT